MGSSGRSGIWGAGLVGILLWASVGLAGEPGVWGTWGRSEWGGGNDRSTILRQSERPGEKGAEPMTASFPNSIPTFTPKVDAVDPVLASHVNRLQEEITALATLLGAGAVQWTAKTYDAGDFSAESEGSWTVSAGDVEAFNYFLLGKTLTVSFSFINTTVAALYLWIKLPLGKTASHAVYTTGFGQESGGTSFLCTVSVPTGGNWIIVGKPSGAWSSAANAVNVAGQISIGIQ